MSLIFNKPEPNTTAFGGVEIGSMKAHDAARVAPINKKQGCTLIASEIVTSTGSNIAVVAMLEVSSVNRFIEATIIKMMRNNL